jgi:hypothetical protein
VDDKQRARRLSKEFTILWFGGASCEQPTVCCGLPVCRFAEMHSSRTPLVAKQPSLGRQLDHAVPIGRRHAIVLGNVHGEKILSAVGRGQGP